MSPDVPNRSPWRRAALLGLVGMLGACATPAPPAAPINDLLTLDRSAEQYVRLVLALGVHDDGYVDAYYGPAAWREAAQAAAMPLPGIVTDARAALDALDAVNPPATPIERLRLGYLRRQLQALIAHAQRLQGQRLSFDAEAQALSDIVPPPLDRTWLSAQQQRLAALLPGGEGTLAERYNAYLSRFAIPPAQLESVMRVTIDEARRRTARRLPLPPGERFELALVSGKSWSAYNWYQGDFHSRIEINTDLPVTADRAIELAVHEGYPGHHVYNALLEQALVRGRGWVEYCVYPLYSPQSLIAEGSADYAIALNFSEEERGAYFQEVLFPLAGLDPAEARRYAQVTAADRFIGVATIAVARDWLDGRIDEATALTRMQQDALASPARARQRLAFFKDYRSYIVNYALGEQRVADYIEALAGDDISLRWLAFRDLLSSPALPADLRVPAPAGAQGEATP